MLFGVYLLFVLESHAQTELQLAHSGRRTWRAISLDVRDLASVAAAVDASVALVRVETEHNVVEDVVRVKAELSLDAFGDREAL